MELVLLGTALGLTGIVWATRALYARRFNAALDAYTERQILGQRPRTAGRPPHPGAR